MLVNVQISVFVFVYAKCVSRSIRKKNKKKPFTVLFVIHRRGFNLIINQIYSMYELVHTKFNYTQEFNEKARQY